jgi:hypothetical protein
VRERRSKPRFRISNEGDPRIVERLRQNWSFIDITKVGDAGLEVKSCPSGAG